MLRLKEVAKFLGKSGIDFLITLGLYFLFRVTHHNALALVAWLALIPPGFIILFRILRFAHRNALWSVRNRLIFAYGLMGVLPVVLLFTLVALGAWAMLNELAIYLASSELDRRIGSLNAAIDAVRGFPLDRRAIAAAEIEHGFSHEFPNLRLYLNDASGQHRYPPDSPALNIPSGWQNVNGLLVLDHHFYGWAHYSGNGEEIAALAPLSDETVENLVPHLGAISLFENPDEKGVGGQPAAAGSFRETVVGSSSNPDVKFNFDNPSRGVVPVGKSHLPPAASRFDVPIWWPATHSHYHLDQPNKVYEGVLWVYSRPSAVLSTFFGGTESLRGVLFDALVTIAVLFLIVELIAVVIGVQLSRRLTTAVNELSEGTRRVIFGDFSHRIAVRSKDQLAELAGSFNQMTGNLERLMAVEKEKERLQTELEIAREVQAQLYPKEAPPIYGLKLTVRCDPARMVSGDYYDYQDLGQGKLAFAIGDVAGKGISAALLMATLAAALRAQLSSTQQLARPDPSSGNGHLDAAHLVATLNKQLYAHTSPEKYATFFFALFDQQTRMLSYTNAGHLSPLLIRNGDVTPLDCNGTVVGAFPFAKYDESSLTMNSGDLLVCYTDGITEPENAYGEMFGEDRLVELVKKHSQREDHEIVGIVLDAVRSWTGTPELSDDMTLLIARGVQLT